MGSPSHEHGSQTPGAYPLSTEEPVSLLRSSACANNQPCAAELRQFDSAKRARNSSAWSADAS